MATSTIKDKGDNLETYNVATGVTAYKRGNVVTIHWSNVAVTTTTDRTVYGTLPIGWRPPDTLFGTQVNGNTGYTNVKADGTVEGFRNTNGRLIGTITYIAAQ